MTREEVIFSKLTTLNIVGNFGRTGDELIVTAQVISTDMEDESTQQICAAIDWWRRNRNTWPKVSDLLEVCDTIRVVDPNQTTLPAGQDRPATPGTGWMADKFLSEGRTLEEFAQAQIVLRQTYEDYRARGETWHANDGAWFNDLLSYLFGDRPKKCLKFGFNRPNNERNEAV